MAKDDEFQKMEVFRRFLNEPLPPLAKIYISNEITEDISNCSNVLETTITPTEKQSINKNGISTYNIIVDNSKSEENEEKSLQPKEMSIKCSALNLPEDIIPLQTFSVKSFSNEKKNRPEFRQKVKIKIIYNATVVYLHDINFAATH